MLWHALAKTDNGERLGAQKEFPPSAGSKLVTLLAFCGPSPVSSRLSLVIFANFREFGLLNLDFKTFLKPF